jgi:transcriptional regulator with XRE-family HTH domain
LAHLGAALQAMRKRRGLTQGELAERTGGSQAHISVIERGTFDFRASTLTAIAAALGCEVLLVPKERAAEVIRSAGLTGRSASPPTVLEEVYIPDPEVEDGDAS